MNFAEYTTASLHVTLEYLLVATSVWIPVLINTEFLGWRAKIFLRGVEFAAVGIPQIFGLLSDFAWHVFIRHLEPRVLLKYTLNGSVGEFRTIDNMNFLHIVRYLRLYILVHYSISRYQLPSLFLVILVNIILSCTQFSLILTAYVVKSINFWFSCVLPFQWYHAQKRE